MAGGRPQDEGNNWAKLLCFHELSLKNVVRLLPAADPAPPLSRKYSESVHFAWPSRF